MYCVGRPARKVLDEGLAEVQRVCAAVKDKYSKAVEEYCMRLDQDEESGSESEEVEMSE